MVWVTGSQVLAFVGNVAPDATETTWADAVASAVDSATTTMLNGSIPSSAAITEIEVAALIASAEAYKRREAIFGLTGYADMEGQAVRVARDYMDGVRPLIMRYSIPGIG